MSSSNRREYLTATVLDQAFLDRCQDNLDNGLHMVVDIESPTGSMIYASDRNKYVGGTFYEALLQFPVIKRSLGEWLAPEIEFSMLQLVLGNVDGRFNEFMPGGANYLGWISRMIDVKLGLRDVASTYTSIFVGRVTDIGGVQRDRKQISLTARDTFDALSVQFPSAVFSDSTLPDIDANLIGTVVPVIYGDWTTGLISGKARPDDPASPMIDIPQVPAYPTNGQAAGVLAGTTPLDLMISVNDNAYLDTTEVYLKRSDSYWLFDAGDIVGVAANRIFSITQGAGGGTTLVDGAAYQYANGDTFFVKVRGKDLGAYDDNIVWQARDLILSYTPLLSSDFDANWATYRDKASPAQSNIAGIKSRIWVQQPQGVMSYVLSLLEQVRLEAFISNEQKLKLNSLHFEDFTASPSFKIRNWDIEEGSFKPVLDDRNIWNRARGAYAFNPSVNENAFETPIYRNAAAVTQAGGKLISKLVVFPNLYVKSDVVNQLREMLRLASSYTEFIDVTLTPRAMLRELGDFVLLNVNMGATILENVPAMIRELSYDPKGMRIPAKLWSMQMVPYPGYAPTYTGITGGNGAAIIEET
jgi:hypothetical protein